MLFATLFGLFTVFLLFGFLQSKLLPTPFNKLLLLILPLLLILLLLLLLLLIIIIII